MRRGGAIRLGVLALLWGTNFLWIKIALRGASPIQVTFTRLALGALVLIGVVLASRQHLPREGRLWGHLTIAALLANAVPYLLIATGEARIDSGVAGVLNATTPLWTILFALAFGDEQRITPTRGAGLALGFTGAVIVFAPWSSAGQVASLGGLAVLAASASYGLSYVYMHSHLTNRGLPPLVLATAQLTASAVLLALALPATSVHDLHLHGQVVAALAMLGVLGTGAAYVVNYRLITDDGPTTASTVTYLLPIVAITAGTLLLTEPLTWHTTAGTATILTGTALVRRQSTAGKGLMRRKSDREKAVASLWKEHLRADFPARLRGEELAGVDMVMLDADVASCVVTWRLDPGHLDGERHQLLLRCIADLDKVMPLLTESSEVQYYKRLRELAVMTSADGR